MWRCRVAGRARTIGNRVYPKRVSRVQIPPSPPLRNIPVFFGMPGFLLLIRVECTFSSWKFGCSVSLSSAVFPLFFPNRFTALINCSMRSALSCFLCSVTWPFDISFFVHLFQSTLLCTPLTNLFFGFKFRWQLHFYLICWIHKLNKGWVQWFSNNSPTKYPPKSQPNNLI